MSNETMHSRTNKNEQGLQIIERSQRSPASGLSPREAGVHPSHGTGEGEKTKGRKTKHVISAFPIDRSKPLMEAATVTERTSTTDC